MQLRVRHQPLNAFSVFFSTGHRAHTVYVGVHVPSDPGAPLLGHRKRSHHRRHRHHKSGKDDKDEERPCKKTNQTKSN